MTTFDNSTEETRAMNGKRGATMRTQKKRWNNKKRRTGSRNSEKNREIMSETSNQIKDMLAQGVVPWVRPWHTAGPIRNALTGHAYGKMNALLLHTACCREHWGDARFLGYQQARKLKGHVKKGERANPIVKIHQWNLKTTFTEEDAVDESAKERKGEVTVVRTARKVAILSVFNVAQCEDLRLPDDPWSPPPLRERDNRVENFLEAVAVPIRDGLDQAFYQHGADHVVVPCRDRFATIGHYYATCFHELTHWTGPELERVMPTHDDDPEGYAFEELVAELGSALLCAHFLVDDQLTEHAARYIASWSKLLSLDHTAFQRALILAQKAVDVLLTRAESGSNSHTDTSTVAA